MEAFEKLGERIEQRWKDENYGEKQFPQIAAQALEESNLVGSVDPWDIIRWVQRAPTLPSQKDVEGRFGNPPITLYAGARFYIDVYFWLDGTTSIHQHSFTGAFQVLLGSSIHSRYSFREDRIINEHLSVGQIKLEDVQLLKLRDVRMIEPGRQFIHALFHLDRPSATITVRTEATPSVAVQWDYRKPHLALDPFFRNPVLAKRLQTVNLLLLMKHEDTDEMLGDLVANSDFHTAYYVLENAFHHLRGNQIDAMFGLSTGADRFNALLDKCRSTHGELADLLPPIFEEQLRLSDIVRRRGTITAEEHRFFLALLLNVSGREKILKLIQQRFPETDPVEKVLDWVEELSRTKVLGSKETNALGLSDFDDTHIFVLECLLKGMDEEATKSDAVATYPADSRDAVISRIPGIVQSLKASTMFRSMLA